MRDETTGRVLETYLERCPPFPLGGPWARYFPNVRVRRPPHDPDAAERALAGAFTAEQLCEAGLAEVGPDGAVSLKPALRDPDGVVVALRGRRGAPFDLLTADGCVSGRRLPALAALRDRWYRRALARFEGNLVVACTPAALAAYVAAGVPAVPAGGLAEVGGTRILALARRFSGPPGHREGVSAGDGRDAGEARARWRAARNLTLVLAYWDASDLSREPPASANLVLTNFFRMNFHLGAGVAAALWGPAEDAVAELRSCLVYGLEAHVWASLVSNVARDAHPLPPPPRGVRGRPAPAPDWRAGLAGLPEAARAGADQLWLAQAAADAAFQRDVVDPLFREAEEETDPLERNRLVREATRSGLYFKALVRAEGRLAEAAADGALGLSPEMLRQLSDVLRLAK